MLQSFLGYAQPLPTNRFPSSSDPQQPPILASQDPAQVPAPLENSSLAPLSHGGYQLQRSVPLHSGSVGDVRSQGSGANSAASAHTSTEINSHNNTIFTHPLSSNHSLTHSLSFVEGSSQPDLADRDNPQSSALSCLQADPMFLSQESLAIALSEDRYQRLWGNWEKNILMQFWLGRHVPDEHCLLAMNTPRTPKTEDPIPSEWRAVSNGILDCYLLTLSPSSSLPRHSMGCATHSHLCENGGR
jgi:hypothetical protein